MSLSAFLARTAAAKRHAADLYRACAGQAPDFGAAATLERIAAEVRAQAERIQGLSQLPSIPLGIAGTPPPEAEGWERRLMVAFALDQAAGAALAGISTCVSSPAERTAPQASPTPGSEPPTRLEPAVLLAVLAQDRDRQGLVCGWLEALALADPALGPALAAHMVRARDWVKAVYPRRQALVELAARGQLPPEAARRHDAFLANLGDRIQEALGVLGD